MAQEIKMSAAGLKAMQEELEYLKTVRRKELAEEIKEARSHGDLSENSDSIFINSINKIKQCCLQLWKDEKSFWKQFFCDKHLLFQLWKSRRSLREEQS